MKTLNKRSEIAPFGAILLRSEAAASSRIENLTASAKAAATQVLAALDAFAERAGRRSF